MPKVNYYFFHSFYMTVIIQPQHTKQSQFNYYDFFRDLTALLTRIPIQLGRQNIGTENSLGRRYVTYSSKIYNCFNSVAQIPTGMPRSKRHSTKMTPRVTEARSTIVSTPLHSC